MELWAQYINGLEEIRDQEISFANRLFSNKVNYDSLLNSKIEKNLVIDVKYRMKENDKPKLKVIKGYSDIQLSNINFQSSGASKNDIAFYTLIDCYQDGIEKLTNILKIQDSLIDEIDRLK